MTKVVLDQILGESKADFQFFSQEMWKNFGWGAMLREGHEMLNKKSFSFLEQSF